MALEKRYAWHKVAESTAELMMGGKNLTSVKVVGREICITHHNSTLYACTANCPHAGGQLQHGWLDAAGNIVCPLHRYKFSVKNGFNSSGEGYFLKTFPIKETDDGVFVGLEIL